MLFLNAWTLYLLQQKKRSEDFSNLSAVLDPLRMHLVY